MEHDGVETDNQYEGQEVAENKETSLMDYHGWLLNISLVAKTYLENHVGCPVTIVVETTLELRRRTIKY